MSVKTAIGRLHRQKDEAYRGAWKRRGERISIVPNIARKVDRLTAIASGAGAISGETILDTAVDLYVYCTKYILYIADCDPTTASKLQIPGPKPFSDHHENFDYLVAGTDLTASAEQSMDALIHEVSEIFERLWPAVESGATAAQRFALAMRMTQASARLVSTVIDKYPDVAAMFIASAQE
jgi:hypothetical protein